MSREPSHDDLTLHDELVAYLDGELSGDETRRLEKRLAEEPDTRRALQELDRTWHMLDSLDAPPVDEDFTRTTIAMVAVAASEDAERLRAAMPRRRRRRRLAVAGGLLAASVAGFLAVYALAPDPNAALRRDLTVLENLDEYRDVDDIALLRTLVAEKLFAEKSDDAEETFPEPQPRLEQMNPNQKEELVRHEEQFLAMGLAQQQQIRQLDEAIRGDADAEKLRETMHRYYHWLGSLPLFRRAELMEMKLPQRVKQIKQILQEQAKSGLNPLGEEDRRALIQWMQQFATDHEAKLLEFAQSRHRPPGKLNAAMRHRIALAVLCQHWQSSNPLSRPKMSDAEAADLRSKLTAETRRRLETMPPPEQAQILWNWFRQAARQELVALRGEGGTLFDFDERLANFFEFELTDEERDRLMSLPAEEMQQRLREMFLMQMKPKGEGGKIKGDGGKKKAEKSLFDYEKGRPAAAGGHKKANE
jgi:hypothetical protein